METTTMITTALDAALASSADATGGAAGIFVARDRVTEPKTAFVSDPRPAGPPV